MTRHSLRTTLLRVAGLYLCLTILLPSAAAGTNGSRPSKSAATFQSGAKPIQVEWFKPEGKGPHPAILLVHESAGMTAFPAKMFRAYSELLAGKGYVVLLVHYFDRTGHVQVDPLKLDELRKYFPVWRETVRDAVKLLASQPNVDPRRVGLLGFSLGSFLALSVAMEKDVGVAAVANLFGGLPDELWGDLKYLPPVLMIGGKKDRLVPARKCYAIRGWCAENGVACDCCVFENQGHLFEDDLRQYLVLAPLLSRDMIEAQSRILGFFSRHLRVARKN
jgi:carboxymethylenebutenolidase